MREENGAYYVEPEEYENLLELLKEQDNMEKAFEVPEDEEAPKVEVSLYELNQMMIAQMPDMHPEQMKENFLNWFNGKDGDGYRYNNYFMLLCNDNNYYTLFHLDWDGSEYDELFWQNLCEVFECVGPVKIMEEDTNGAFSIWANWLDKGIYHCFYLFPYDKGVVEVR